MSVKDFLRRAWARTLHLLSCALAAALTAVPAAGGRFRPPLLFHTVAEFNVYPPTQILNAVWRHPVAARIALQPPLRRTVVGLFYSTTLDHVLAMAFDDPWMDDDLRQVLDAHEVVLDGEWPDVW